MKTKTTTPNGGTTTPSGGGTTTPTEPVAGSSVPVSITAVNEQDNIPRDWNIFASDPSGKYQGGGNWAGVAPQQTAYFTNGGTWNLQLAKGTYYLCIGQSGGTGSYHGTITVGGQPYDFSGNDVNHATRFVVS
jgi:hypothetical protein